MNENINLKENEKNMDSNLALKQEEIKCTYADMLKIDDGNRYELIDGDLYLMASPSTLHQEIILEIAHQLKTFLKGKKCRAFIAPLDVKLSGQEDDKEIFVVQPDIMIVCDPNKIKEKNILGAPDVVMEVLSPSNASHDRLIKLNLYQKFGVKEYWMISLEDKLISVYSLNEHGIYTISEVKYLDEKVKVNIYNECYIDLKDFCKEHDIDIQKTPKYKVIKI